jgi:hypothetical protein
MAARLGIPRTTIASRVHAAVERVRDHLRKRGVAVPPSNLAGIFATSAGMPVPQTLTAALAKFAIAGVGIVPPAACGGATIMSGGTLIMAKKAAIGVFAAALLLLLASFSYHPIQAIFRSDRENEFAAVGAVQNASIGAAAAADSANEKASQTSSSSTREDKTGKEDSTASAQAVGATVSGKSAAHSKDGAGKKGSAASVSGYVLDEANYAFPDASVRIEIMNYQSGSQILDKFDVTTDTNGLYALKDIHTFGNVNVYASAKGFLTQKRYALRLTPGANLTVGFTLIPGKFFVRGAVEDQSGKPVEGAEIQLRREEDMNNIYSFAQALSDADGKFEISSEWEGSCDFAVVKEGYGTGFFPNISTGTEDAKFVIRSPGAIAGCVSMPDGTPVPGACVEVAGEAFPQGGSPSEGGQPIPMEPQVGTCDEQGRYVVGGLGESYFYTVRLVSSGGRSADTIGEDAPQIIQMVQDVFGSPSLGLHRGVRVRAGETTEDIDFTVNPVACIQGRVTDKSTGAPVYHVILLATKGQDYFQTSDSGWIWTQEDGSYTLKMPVSAPTTLNVLYMYLGSLGKAWNIDPQLLGTVEVSPGAVIQRDFAIDAPCVVPVRVVDAAGQPIAGAGLRFEDVTSHSCSGGLDSTDADGRFTIYGIPANRPFRILAVSGAYGETNTTLSASEALTGAPGETLSEVTIVVTSQGGIEGTVVDASALPIPNLELQITAVGPNGQSVSATAVTNTEGTFTILRAFQVGTYSQITITTDDRGMIERATIPNVEIVADGVSELGPVVLIPAGSNPKQ